MRPTSLRYLLTVCAGLTLFSQSQADELAMPAATGEAATSISTPDRGVTMARVEAKFGAPTERHAAIGHPPITRWDYPGFSVFFEYDHVIHSVIK